MNYLVDLNPSSKFSFTGKEDEKLLIFILTFGFGAGKGSGGTQRRCTNQTFICLNEATNKAFAAFAVSDVTSSCVCT